MQSSPLFTSLALSAYTNFVLLSEEHALIRPSIAWITNCVAYTLIGIFNFAESARSNVIKEEMEQSSALSSYLII